MEREDVVRRRRVDDSSLRRGSIKSRIFQLSKRRRKEPPDTAPGEAPSVPDHAPPTRTSRAPGACGVSGPERAPGVQRPAGVPGARAAHREPKPWNSGSRTGSERRGSGGVSIEVGGGAGRQVYGQGVTHRGAVPRNGGPTSRNGDPSSHSQTCRATTAVHSDPPRAQNGASVQSPAPSDPVYAQSTKRRAAPTQSPPTIIPDTPEGHRVHHPSNTHKGVPRVPKPQAPERPTHLALTPVEDEPWHLQPSPEVTLRASKISNDSLEPGRLLNSAIARHFRNLHCQGGPEPGKFPLSTSARVLSTKLSLYMREVFTQLDSLHQGWISREDFDALCEILGVSSQPVGRRTSGLEWLPSYQPRPHTPGSPLRMDRLGEVRYHPPQPNPPKDPPSFLWTIGPRPFWEMWPARRNRRKNLSLQEFTESLLEQWAVTHGYTVEEVRYSLNVENFLVNKEGKDKIKIGGIPIHTYLFFVNGVGVGSREKGTSGQMSVYYKSVIEELHASLRLSDAQNLALHVLLRKMAKTDTQLEVVKLRPISKTSETHLESLLSDLGDVVQTKNIKIKRRRNSCKPRYERHQNSCLRAVKSMEELVAERVKLYKSRQVINHCL